MGQREQVSRYFGTIYILEKDTPTAQCAVAVASAVFGRLCLLSAMN